MDTARELSRRRIISNRQDVDRDIRSAYVEVLFLSQFGRQPRMEDLKRDKYRYDFMPTDDAGRSIRIIMRQEFPLRVYQRFLDADVYVFAKLHRLLDMSEVLGWLPRDEVVQAPRLDFPAQDRREPDYCHEVGAGHYAALPKVFNFTESCPHIGQLWDYTTESWECFGCGRRIYSKWDREHIAAQSATSWKRHKVSEGASADECKES